MGNASTSRLNRQFSAPPTGGGRHYGQYQARRPTPSPQIPPVSRPQMSAPQSRVPVIAIRAGMILFGLIVGLAFGGWGGGIVAATCAFGLVLGLLGYLRQG